MDDFFEISRNLLKYILFMNVNSFMKGFNFSVGFTMTDFRGRKPKADKKSDGPSPVPENSSDLENQDTDSSLSNEN